jgi:hypothetical protein
MVGYSGLKLGVESIKSILAAMSEQEALRNKQEQE